MAGAEGREGGFHCRGREVRQLGGLGVDARALMGWGGSVREILVIRWKSIGDVVFALPAVNVLRGRFPGARITLMVSKENAFVAEGFEAVDRVWTVDRDALRGRRVLAGLRETAGLIGEVRRAGFDLAVDLQGYGETAALTRWSGAPLRWGYGNGALRSRAFTTAVARDPGRHPAMGHLDLLARAGIAAGKVSNAFRVRPGNASRARQFLAERGHGPGSRWAYVQPFTSAASKNWPLDRYLQLAVLLRSQGCRVLWGGGEEDRGAMTGAGVPGHELIPSLPRSVMAGILGEASLVVGGDTGFVHLAVALGRPVVMVGNRSMVLPLCEHGVAVRGATEHMGDVGLEAVAAATTRQLERRPVLQACVTWTSLEDGSEAGAVNDGVRAGA